MSCSVLYVFFSHWSRLGACRRLIRGSVFQLRVVGGRQSALADFWEISPTVRSGACHVMTSCTSANGITSVTSHRLLGLAHVHMKPVSPLCGAGRLHVCRVSVFTFPSSVINFGILSVNHRCRFVVISKASEITFK